jgi:23S rRNA (cytosine1962-C5)-methyltransferase
VNKVILKKGRERSLLRQHPWIFSGAVKRMEGASQFGGTVDVLSHDGSFLGRGAYSPSSQIRVRIWTFDEKEAVDSGYFQKRVQASIDLREALQIPEQTEAYRLVSAEADGLPGLIVDRYGEFLVCQFLSAGAEQWKNTIVDHLKALTGVKNIYERSDVDVRQKEGLNHAKGLMAGEAPPSLVEVNEKNVKFFVDIKNGHKTGFYLDQRDNRHLVRSHARGKDVLNCFAYTGGFGLAALKGGARHVTNVEDSTGLVELIDKNLELNQIEKDSFANVKADVFKLLRQYVKEGRLFDIIVLDPPKFAESQAHLARACRGYKDINLLALKLLRPGGLLFTFSCSGLMKMDLFQKIVADAAIDSGRDMQVMQWLGQSADHPVKLSIPESMYLKGLFTRVVP